MDLEVFEVERDSEDLILFDSNLHPSYLTPENKRSIVSDSFTSEDLELVMKYLHYDSEMDLILGAYKNDVLDKWMRHDDVKLKAGGYKHFEIIKKESDAAKLPKNVEPIIIKDQDSFWRAVSLFLIE